MGTKFLALENSFHGRTMGAVSTTHKDKYREPFQPLVPGVEFVRFNDVDHLRASFSNEVCAMLIEADPGRRGHPAGVAGVFCCRTRAYASPPARC